MGKQAVLYCNRFKLLQSIAAFQVCYPEDSCKQFRALKSVWLPIQSDLSIDLSNFFSVRHYEQVEAAFVIGKIRGILLSPKNFIKHFYGWNNNKARKFPVIRI